MEGRCLGAAGDEIKMSREARFVKLPTEHAEAWYALKYWDRALGADLFRTFGNDERIAAPLCKIGDIVCRALGVDGRDRPTVRRALERIIAAGLLVEDDEGFTRLLYSPQAYRAWHRHARGESVQSSTRERATNDSLSSGEGAVINLRSTGERAPNGRSNTRKPAESHDSGSTEREKEREKEETAREPDARASELDSDSLGRTLQPGDRIGTCPRCNSPVVVRAGKHGLFAKCGNRHCDHKISSLSGRDLREPKPRANPLVDEIRSVEQRLFSAEARGDWEAYGRLEARREKLVELLREREAGAESEPDPQAAGGAV